MDKNTTNGKTKTAAQKKFDLLDEIRLEKEAREYAKEIIATIREPLVVLDVNLRVVLANKSFYKDFQVNPEETIGQYIYDLGNKQWDIPQLRQLLEDILPKNTEFESFEVKHNFESIGLKTMLLNARRIPRLPKKPKIILLAIEDVTERRKSEQHLDKAILASISDAVFVVDRNLKIIMFNQAAEKITECKSAEAIGKDYREVVHFISERDYKLKELFKHDVISGQSKLIDNHIPLILTDGQQIPVDETASTLKDNAGNILGFVIVFRNISRQRETEQAKDDFLSIAAHDLRTPMSGIRVNIEMILKGDYGKIPPKLKIPLEDIYQANLHLVKMVNDFLTLSRIEKGKITITPQPIDLVPIINIFVKQMKSLTKRKDLEFNYEIPAKIPLVLADPGKIPELVNNLLDNAIKFTDKGSISLRVLPKKDQVVVAVMDTGIGIAKDRQKDLFKKYAQVGTKERVSYGKGTGLGLGLYISRLIVEGCGGKIWVESVLGKGSTFYFSLPMAKK